ncbi:MAG TPA: 50S ribosomal protein L11 methyltransferase [Lacunisphaera sp.]|jgi:ribosomal protein L11 methyltransferase|nr:50S ribosomal protein L11 methyltransferase [Lacunisphaera sp.]
MAIVELKVVIAAAAADVLEEILGETEEQRLMLIEDRGLPGTWLVGYFGSAAEALTAWDGLRALVPAGSFSGEPVLRELADADWRDSYKVHFKAWRFGSLHWVPIWERDHFKLPTGEQVLWLDPGLAFGTGNHETTRLVVERLVANERRHGSKGRRVIDAGCGSGILALSAVKLGFRHVSGFDLDSTAIQVSQENAALNELAGEVDFFCADLVAGLVGREAELVLANIQADVLIRHARELVRAVAPGGSLVLSGILAREGSSVEAVFAAAQPAWPRSSRILGEWCDLELVRC